MPKSKKAGVRRYRPKPFSISNEVYDKLQEYAWVNWSELVNEFLLSFIPFFEKENPTSPLEIYKKMQRMEESTQ